MFSLVSQRKWFTETTGGDTIQIYFGEYPVSNDSFFFVSAGLLDLVEQYYIDQKEVSFYADRLSLSNKSANELSKKVLGKTIKKKYCKTASSWKSNGR